MITANTILYDIRQQAMESITPATHKNTRPLGMFSHMILHQMPKEVLGERLSTLVNDTAVKHQVIDRLKGLKTREEQLLARLDIMMAVTALRVRNGKITPVIQELLDESCKMTGQPPVLTYEDIILTNPINEMRTFLPPESHAGSEEMLFYVKHMQMEQALGQVLETVMKATSGQEIDEDDIEVVKHNTALFNRLMVSFGKMDSGEAFRKYREYFIGFQKCIGPSGYFSSRIVSIDFLLSGYDILDEYHDDLVLNQDTFPQCEKDLLRYTFEAVEKGNTLKNLAQSDEKSKQIYQTLYEQFDSFRKRHYQIAKLYVPGLEKSDHGTADRAHVLPLRQGMHQKASGCPMHHRGTQSFDREALIARIKHTYLPA